MLLLNLSQVIVVVIIFAYEKKRNSLAFVFSKQSVIR